MSEIITFGEPMVVWIPEETGNFSEVTHFTKGVAGAELNVSIGAARLGHTVTYLTKLGTDVTGQFILDLLKKEGVDTGAIQMDSDHLTGTYFKTKVTSGDPKVFYMRKNSAASTFSPEDIDRVDFSKPKFLHLTGIGAAISESCYKTCVHAIDRARQQNPDITVTFDPNIRPALWPSQNTMVKALNQLALQADIVLPGIAEGRILTGADTVEDIADFYLSHGVRKAVIVKDGGNGAYFKTKSGESGRVPGFHVDHIADTVGAGDAFATGVITALLEGLTITEAVLRGNAMGAKMITVPGDNDALPTKEELDEILKKGHC